MAFAALTEIEYSVEFNPVIRSDIVFLKFLGVEWLVASWFNVCIALSIDCSLLSLIIFSPMSISQ
jgi:hypothetical protein